jgi:hypothetical protein
VTIQRVDLTLAGATLSGGARLAASGGGLPQRLTTELDGVIDTTVILGGGSVIFQGVVLAADNSGDVIGVSTGSSVKRFNGSGTSWTQLYSTSVSIARSLARGAAGKLMISRNTAGVQWYELDETSGVATAKTLPSSTLQQIFMVPGGTADRAWYHNGGSPATELVLSTGAASGRTLVLATGCLACTGSNWDGTPSIYVLETATKITRYNESTLALMDTWLTAPGSDVGPPCSDFGRSPPIVQADGRLIVKSDAPYGFDRLPAVGGSEMHSNAGVDRLTWGSTELAGVVRSNLSGGAQLMPGMDISANGRWMTWIASTAASVFARAIQVRNIQTQTVEWSRALAGESALIDFNLPGNLGNHYGLYGALYNGHAGALADHRNARVYYQRVGIDGAKQFLTHGAYIAPGGLSLVGASALKIGVEFDRGLGKLTTSAGPYIGGPSGEGPTLYFENGITDQRNRLQGSM